MPLTGSDIGPIANLRIFSIRNGEAKDAYSLITKAAIPDYYKWRPIGNLPPELAMKHADMFIRSAEYQMKLHNDANISPAVRRKLAIIIGTARAVMTAYYSLARADLIPGETEEPVITYTAPARPTDSPTWNIAAGVEEAAKAELMADLSLTKEEKGAMSVLVLCAVGIPPMQGASLMMTGHHYLDDVRSRAIYTVVEKQFWKKADLKDWIAEETGDFRGALWHKAGHPVNMSIKYRMAVDPKVPAMLKTAGAGSCASRLPAKESELKMGETVRTLMINVRPFFEAYKGIVNFDLLSEAIDLANCYVPSTTVPDAAVVTVPGVNIDDHRTNNTPPWVNSRETAIKWVEEIVNRNADMVALAFGFFEALCDSSVGGDTAGNTTTLRGANSLHRFRGNCFAGYSKGREAHQDYASWKAKERAAGNYAPINLALL